jgi:WD40 repeat protein
VSQAYFSPDNNRLVTLSTGTVAREEKEMPDGKKPFLVFQPEKDLDGNAIMTGALGAANRVPGLVGGIGVDPLGPLDNMFSPSRRRMTTPRGRPFIWDTATNKPIDVKLPPDSQVLAVTPDGGKALIMTREKPDPPASTQIWDLTTGTPIGEPEKFNYRIGWAASSGDGKTFATILGDWLILWDAATGKRTSLDLQSKGIHRAALSPDGRVVAVVSPSGFGRGPGNFQPPPLRGVATAVTGEVELFDLKDQKALPGLLGGLLDRQVDAEAAVAIGPGGRFVLTVGPSDGFQVGEIRLWDRDESKVRRLPETQSPPHFAQFSPDGKVLLTASAHGLTSVTEGIQLWDTATGQPRGSPLLPGGPVQSLAFSPDSRLVAIGNANGELQIWETATGKAVSRPLRQPGPVYSIAFAADGSKVVTGGRDGLARIFETHSRRAVPPLRSLERVTVVRNDGSRCIQKGNAGGVRMFEMTTIQPCGESIPFGEKDRILTIAPDKQTLVIANGNSAQIWNGVTGKPIGGPLTHAGSVSRCRFSPDSKLLWTFVESTSPLTTLPITYRWEVATGRSLFEKNEQIGMARTISPDGRWALRVRGPSVPIVWQLGNARGGGPPPKALEKHPPLTGALFSPDSRSLLTVAATAGSWEEARLWDPETGRHLGAPMPHQAPIQAMVFSCNSKVIFTACFDGTARFWDAATAKQLGPVMAHGSRVRAIALSADLNLAATAGDDGTARLWHVATGKQLGPPLVNGAPVPFVAFGMGGDTLITWSPNEQLRVWKLPQPMQGKSDALLLQAEAETGMSLDGGSPRLLDDAERDQRWKQFSELK